MSRSLISLELNYLQLFVELCCLMHSSRRRRRWQVRPINQCEDISLKRQFVYFMNMKDNDPEQFFKYTRMTKECYMKLLNKVTPLILGSTRRAIPAEMKLAVFLQYVTQGSTKQKEAWSFEIGRSTVSKIIDEVCSAIITVLKDEYLKPPSKDEWISIANYFEERWNVPNVIGAVDGKHFHIQKPKNSGSLFRNYKQTFSIVLMATVDGQYRFRIVDVGSYGSEHDSAIFQSTGFGQAIINGTASAILGVPEPRLIKGLAEPLPFFLVADDAFPLKEQIMKPYGGKSLDEKKMVFNYRLSRARRVVENAFGILAARFRIFRNTMNAEPEQAEKYVFSCVLLHNYIISEECNLYIPADYVDHEDEDGNVIEGLYRQELNPGDGFQPLPPTAHRNFCREAGLIRDTLAEWFVGIHGFLQWQMDYVRRFRGLHH